jgi:hypothetical protein
MDNINETIKAVEELLKSKPDMQNLRDALYQEADTQKRLEDAGGGLIAMPAGTWTPEEGWLSAVRSIQYAVENFKKVDDGDIGHDWPVVLKQLEELCEKLVAIVAEAQ